MFLIGCQEDQDKEVVPDKPSVTSEIKKVETSYKEGMTKIEGKHDGKKVETVMDQELLDEIVKEANEKLEKSTSKVHSNA